MILRQAALLMGTSAVDGKLSPRFCSACRHPLALLLLAFSLIVGAAMTYFDPLDLGSRILIPTILLGLVSYAAVVATARWVRPRLISPELDELNSVRNFMRGKLLERPESFGVAMLLTKAVQQLDAKVVPTLRRLIERQHEQADLLQRYETGRLPAPGAAELDSLKTNVERQKAVIAESVEQVSNGIITFVNLMQQSEGTEDGQVDAWFKDLSVLYEILTDVMNNEQAPTVTKRPPPVVTRVVRTEPCDDRTSAYIRVPVEAALRRLNNLAALADSDLVKRLPRTLAEVGGHSLDELTPIENARNLQRVLIEAIDMLKPVNGDLSVGSGGAIYYHILNAQYVERRPNVNIVVRLGLSESVFFRTRKDAITAVVQHLESQEANLAECGDRNGNLTPVF